MSLIRCTQKLLKVVGTPKENLLLESEEGLLGDWYANLIWIDGRKCILFTNARTLFSFFTFDIKKADITPFDQFFRQGLERNLRYAGFEAHVIEKGMQEYQSVGIGKTASKSVLGSMNDLAAHCSYGLPHKSNITPVTIIELNSKLNKIPMGALKYNSGVEELTSLLQGAGLIEAS